MSAPDTLAHTAKNPVSPQETLTLRRGDTHLSRTYKLRVEKNRVKEELKVMVLNSDGTSDLYSMTRPEILEMTKVHGRRMRTTPFGEVKLKDLRMLDPNVSFGSEPKILVRTLCAMISINPIHAFVLPDRVLMFVPDGADGILHSIRNHLKEIIQASNMEDLSSDDPSKEDERSGYGDAEHSHVSTKLVSDPIIAHPVPGHEGDDRTPLVDARTDHEESDSAPHIHHRRASSHGSDGSVSKVHQRSILRTRSYASLDETPFQFVALELIFDTAALSFKKEVDLLKLEREKIRSMIQANELFTKVNALKSRIIATRETVEDFMSDEKDLGLFSFDSIMESYATPTGPVLSEEAHATEEDTMGVDTWQPYEEDVNEVEDLAEDFVSRLDDAVNEIDMLKFTIEEVHSNLKHMADLRRERLMKCNIRIQGVTCLAAAPTLVAGLFGMNLYTGLWTEGDTANFWITFWLMLGFFMVGTVAFVYLSNRFFLSNDFGEFEG